MSGSPPVRTQGLVTAVVLAAKSLRVFTRTPQLVGATLGQGVLFLLVFRFVFGGAIDTGAYAYVDFITPGIVTATILFAAAGAAVGVADDRAAGFTQRVLSMPTPHAAVAAGRTLADTVTVLLAVAATVAAAVLVGFRPQSSSPNLLMAAGLICVYAFAFAALFGVLGGLADGPQTAQALGFVAIPLTFVSSAYVPTQTMPSWLAAVAGNQPVTHMVEALRALLFADVASQTGSRLLLPAALWATGIAVASAVALSRQVRNERMA